MEVTTLLPVPELLRIDRLECDDRSITVVAVTTQLRAACPLCGRSSDRVHSRYARMICDLPWQGVAVRIHLCTRRFFCDGAACKRTIFAERLPGVVASYARRTDRLQSALALIGYALGGEAGARICMGLGLTVSPDTLIRRVLTCVRDNAHGPEGIRVLGVDDWAFRRGRDYGTILVDLERGSVIDLLPDRTAETLTTWLKEHPGIEIVSRDRASAYADAARAGAPKALQIADRFHLIKNLREAVERALLSQHPLLRQASESMASSSTEPAEIAGDATGPLSASPKVSIADQTRSDIRSRRLALFEKVHALHEKGLSKTVIGKRVGLRRGTVGKYLKMDSLPERAVCASRLDPFKPHIAQRVEEGRLNGCRIYDEVVAQGFVGVRSPVLAYIASLRAKQPVALAEAKGPVRRVSPGAASWLFIRRTAELSAHDRQFLEALCNHERLSSMYSLTQRFAQMLRGKDNDKNADELAPWVADAATSGVTEIARFAKGLKQDLAAVEAALSKPWSNGPVEGSVNRLKLIKRQMYGRAGFDLVRSRVLGAAQLGR